MTNMMQHSTCVLDISDDEGKRASDGRGKENIPPAELGIPLPNSSTRQQNSSASRKAVDMDEDRAPLGELATAGYYGDGCHAFSYAVVYDDECENSPNETGKTSPVSKSTPHIRRSSALQNVESISAILGATAPAKPKEPKPAPSDLDFEIWECGSAAGETAESSCAVEQRP